MVKVYDECAVKIHNGVKIDYGIKNGSAHTVFIKTGKGGNIYGENETQMGFYGELAEKINAEFSYTVIVSSTPLEDESEDQLSFDMAFVNEFKREDIEYIGYSSGANNGAWYGYQFDAIKSMLLINPILNFNFHKMQKCCLEFKGERIVFAMGENDQSSKYSFMIPRRQGVESIVLEGQPHRVDREVLLSTVISFLRKTQS